MQRGIEMEESLKDFSDLDAALYGVQLKLDGHILEYIRSNKEKFHFNCVVGMPD